MCTQELSACEALLRRAAIWPSASSSPHALRRERAKARCLTLTDIWPGAATAKPVTGHERKGPDLLPSSASRQSATRRPDVGPSAPFFPFAAIPMENGGGECASQIMYASGQPGPALCGRVRESDPESRKRQAAKKLTPESPSAAPRPASGSAARTTCLRPASACLGDRGASLAVCIALRRGRTESGGVHSAGVRFAPTDGRRGKGQRRWRELAKSGLIEEWQGALRAASACVQHICAQGISQRKASLSCRNSGRVKPCARRRWPLAESAAQRHGRVHIFRTLTHHLSVHLIIIMCCFSVCVRAPACASRPTADGANLSMEFALPQLMTTATASGNGVN
jgi:hypothetical protein